MADDKQAKPHAETQDDDTGTKAEAAALEHFHKTGKVKPGFVLDYRARPIIQKQGK